MTREEFVSFALKNLFKHGISVELDYGKINAKKENGNLSSSGANKIKSNGYFCEQDKILYCRINDKDESWFEIFVHEYCHFLQHLDNKFTNSSYWDDMDAWLLGKKKRLSRKRLDRCFRVVMNCELDCEKRAVKLIKRYNLPINVKTYTKKANVYILFYTMVRKYRKWYKRLPTAIPELYNMMPSEEFWKTWNNPPKEFERIILQKCLA